MKKLYFKPCLTTEDFLIEDVLLASDEDGITDNRYDGMNRIVNGRAIAHGDSLMNYYE